MPRTPRPAQTAGMLTPARIHPLQLAMAATAIAAMLSAHFGQMLLYAWLKPLPLLLALGTVGWLLRPRSQPIAQGVLLIGLLLSMVGDICLLWERGFVPGLIAFLCAHIAYLLLLRRDVPRWLPSPLALLACLTVSGALYAYLWTHGLPAALRLPVLAYVVVIATMAAQALGRATVLRTRAAACVAAGALCFMASDSMLAFDKFVQPVPASYLWVLGSYYLAQWLIVHGMLPALREQKNQKQELAALAA